MKTRKSIFPAAVTGLFGIFLSCLQGHISAAPAGNGALAFRPGVSGEFTFDTGILRGKIRAGGKSRGLSSVLHVPSGVVLDRSMGLFSHYRVFSANHRYGTAAWDWPSEAKLAADGSLEVNWPAAPDRPFDLSAVYRWSAANCLDLETRVTAKTNLSNFESFLASYFSEGFTNAHVYVNQVDGNDAGKHFLPVEAGAGVWQVFPRNEAVLPLIQDGRWKIEPNPVDWIVRPKLAAPLGFRRSPSTGVTAVLMAPPEECFAISSPHQAEGHYSMYLSLFGRSLKEGESARARARLLILERATDAEIVRAFETYLRQLR